MTKNWHRRRPPLAPREPAEALDGVRKLMNWGPFLDVDVAKVARETESVFTPAFDILETESYYAFLADLPGIQQDALCISWTAGAINIAGAREPETVADRADYYALERTFGRFCRAFSLPAGVCTEQTSATLKDGVLTVLVPKALTAEPSRVPIHDVAQTLNEA